MTFTTSALVLNPETECSRIVGFLSKVVRKDMRRRGAVVGISGGIDSSLVLALCVRAFGPNNVIGVIMPERESSPESEALARQLAGMFGITPVFEDLTAALEGAGCYVKRDEAIKRIFPEYDSKAGYKARITLPPRLLDEGTLNVFSLTILQPDGDELKVPLSASSFRQIVAASNYKQRSRMATLYYHAELNHFAVIGTANKNEHDLGFFVKYGDGGVDANPITYLYKTQVYQLAEHLGVPHSICSRPPTTDTYSAPTTQEEFFFRLPFVTLDLLWYALEHDVPVDEVARVMRLTEKQVTLVQEDIIRKRQTTNYLRQSPIPLEVDGPSVGAHHAYALHASDE